MRTGWLSPARFSPQMGSLAVLRQLAFSAAFLVPVLFSVGFLPAEDGSETPWKRIVVIGASASAGFNTWREAGKTVNIAKVIEAMLGAEHDKVVNVSSGFFFMNPRWMGTQSIRRAVEVKATLVVAVDFLFWFGYGAKSEEKRFEDLDVALKYLSELECLVLLSRIPDMKASVGKMLSARMVPKSATLKKLNARIDAWSAGRKNIIMVPVAKFIDDLRAGKGIEVAEISYPAGSLRKLLQRDELHPTLEGLAAVTALSLIKLCEYSKEVSTDDFEMDPQVIKERVIAAVRAAKKKPPKAPAKKIPPLAESKESEKDGGYDVEMVAWYSDPLSGLSAVRGGAGGFHSQ